ncbi:hypothetical protein MROS_0782 [Melioribacter roseus P3M-2]|uniref:Uncharacterized protein n=1 Tax=Melioribacter roseus (strain DSM 23840 / JCM 17771 / VKM B-2668 / P3M-2) TaxID=1191523 RepID=I6ZPR0_MELRP|nr:hypothetical protein [Melioribacter roseus]AFN74024.1 hypothetical protein MROS_0782 [Melioribacter roseus P3M-2]
MQSVKITYLLPFLFFFMFFYQIAAVAQNGWSFTTQVEYTGIRNGVINNTIRISGAGNWNIAHSTELIYARDKINSSANDVLTARNIFYNFPASSLYGDAESNGEDEMNSVTTAINSYARLPFAFCNEYRGDYEYGFSFTIRKYFAHMYGFGGAGYIIINSASHPEFNRAAAYGIGIGKRFYDKTINVYVYLHGYKAYDNFFDNAEFISWGINYNFSLRTTFFLLSTLEVSEIFSEYSFSYGLKWSL